MMPLLYVYGCVAGLLGGMVVAAGMLDVSATAYMDRTLEALTWAHLGLGITKSAVFGALIGLIGCYCGLFAKRNAAGVGVATTHAVVASIVGIIVLDAIFAVCANALEI
jgi:ABC-type transporter Mla maintaining outer membrane lipid asymmetry permease subunit MlaE